MKIIEWHFEGGLGYMLTLSLLGLVMIGLFVRHLITRSTPTSWSASATKQIGLFCFFLGLFAQVIGLIQAFDYVEAAGDISTAMLAGGLKVSFITTAYGLFILILSRILYFYLTQIQVSSSQAQLAEN
ncbi:MAG: MotA/TolQ/ExbB proton channel family protein [Cyclobacteriaceae bacterium]